jgi:hypothetical protein
VKCDISNVPLSWCSRLQSQLLRGQTLEGSQFKASPGQIVCETFISKKPSQQRSGGVAQLVEALSSNPGAAKKRKKCTSAGERRRDLAKERERKIKCGKRRQRDKRIPTCCVPHSHSSAPRPSEDCRTALRCAKGIKFPASIAPQALWVPTKFSELGRYPGLQAGCCSTECPGHNSPKKREEEK